MNKFLAIISNLVISLLFTFSLYGANMHSSTIQSNHNQVSVNSSQGGNVFTKSNTHNHNHNSNSSNSGASIKSGDTITSYPAIPQPPDHSKEHPPFPFEWHESTREQRHRQAVDQDRQFDRFERMEKLRFEKLEKEKSVTKEINPLGKIKIPTYKMNIQAAPVTSLNVSFFNKEANIVNGELQGYTWKVGQGKNYTVYFKTPLSMGAIETMMKEGTLEDYLQNGGNVKSIVGRR